MTKTTGERVPPNDALTGSDGSFFRAVCAAAISSNAARRMGLQIKNAPCGRVWWRDSTRFGRGHTVGLQAGMPTYPYQDAEPTYANSYLWPTLRGVVEKHTWPKRRAFDLGCGNGATCNMLSTLGFEATGVDTSESGVANGQKIYPHAKLAVGSAYDDLPSQYGTFPLVVSLEVIEHCTDPHAFAKSFLGLIAPGGIGFLSTPYHGYLKNLALAVTGKMDRHFTALWPGGHVKFFSMATLGQLLNEAGAKNIGFIRVGRIPPLAKSMVAVVQNVG
jgi:2-polyprenyl-3-methyl-5-hydroxy-6-metoxy-1,4-benzoquinol methylase